MEQISGYKPLDKETVGRVNKWKELELSVLKLIDGTIEMGANARWASIAKTHFEQGAMAIVRSIIRPTE